jgi:hypothetical protein
MMRHAPLPLPARKRAMSAAGDGGSSRCLTNDPPTPGHHAVGPGRPPHNR